MAEREVGIDRARPKLGELAADAATEGTVTILTLRGHPLARIVPLEGASGRTPSDAARRFTEQQYARRVADLGKFRVDEWESLIAEESLTPDRVFSLMHCVFEQGLGGGFPGVPSG